MKKTLLLLIALTIALSACGGPPPPKEITLLAEDIVWNPPLIEAEPGQELVLTVRNDGALDHNFVSPELGFDVLVSPGETEVISFVVTEAGTIDFICDIPGHEEAGMVGQIIVR